MFYILQKDVAANFLKCFTTTKRDFKRIFSKIPIMADAGHGFIKTFVFFDLETTGLPSQEGNRTKITEMVFIAVQAEHFKKGVFPRVQNKLNLCFHPQKRISDISSDITGLDNFLLEHLQTFSEKTVDLLDNFLEHQPKPICLVAHNGNMFDYPILKAEILKTGRHLKSDVYCIDSLEAFREILPDDEENAEQDVVDLSTCISDEMLIKAAENFENSAREVFVTETDRALQIQKINETTPKKPTRPLTFNPSKKMRTNLFPTKLNYFRSGFKLQDIFKKLVPSEKFKAHMAENDVIMLLKCAVATHSQFLNWANENAKKLKDIPPMEPGKKIGTCQPIF